MNPEKMKEIEIVFLDHEGTKDSCCVSRVPAIGELVSLESDSKLFTVKVVVHVANPKSGGVVARVFLANNPRK